MINHLGQIAFEALMTFVSFASILVLFGTVIGLVVWMFIQLATKD